MSLKDKVNIGYFPSLDETLEGFVERVRHIIAEENGYLTKHVDWYVHKGAGPCPICNVINCCHFITDLMVDINVVLKAKKIVLKCYRDPNNPDPLLYRFRLHPR